MYNIDMSFFLSVDGACDIDYAQLKAFGVKYKKFLFRLNRTEPVHDNLTLFSDYEALRSRLNDGEHLFAVPVSPLSYDDYFDKILETGVTQILHLSVGSAFSRAFDFAQKSAIKSSVKFPKAQIFVLDTSAFSSAMQPLVEKAISLREQGYGVGEAFVELTELKNSLSTFVVTEGVNALIDCGLVPPHSNKGSNLAPLYLYEIKNGEFTLLSRHKGGQSLAKKIEEKALVSNSAFVSLSSLTEPTQNLPSLIPTQISNLGLYATALLGTKATVIALKK